MSGRRFFLFWMLAFVGFPLGGFAAFLVVGSIEEMADGAVSGALTGAVVGAAQWLALRGRLAVGLLWIPATALGLGVGDAVGSALTGAGTGIGALIVTGLASGLAVGLLQWALLRRLVRAAWIWPLVVTVAWPLGWTVTWTVGIDVERAYAVFGSSGALVFAAITGTAMLLMMRGRYEYQSERSRRGEPG